MSSRASYVDNPYIDARGRTDAETYLIDVLEGSVVAGQKLVKLAEKMLPRIRDGYKQWHFDAEAATRPVEFIEKFCMIPSGKLGVPFVLEPYERMIVELTFGFVDDDGARQIQYTLVEMARKQGKALSLDTEIPTPDGWRTMADVHVGDVVFGYDGKPSTVIAESDVFDKPMYLVTFDDGARIKASHDHIWTVHLDDDDPLGLDVEMTTGELADGFGPRRYSVPVALPVEYPRAELPRDPFEVGSDFATGRIGSIPDEYMTACIEQRMDLSAGILANARRDGVPWVFQSEESCRTVAELESSLGYLAEVRRSGDSWELWDMPGWVGKRIASIEPIPNEPSKCIAIDNDSHLYLAGRQYTATHNTSLSAAIEIYMLIADGEGAPQIYNAATSKSQASLAYGAVWRMVRQSPKLMKYLHKGVVTERAETGIICDANMGYIVPLSKQSDHLDGLDVHFSVLDEMAAMTDRSTFDLVKQGTGARTQPLMIAITTQGFVRDNIWDQERNYAVKWLDGTIDDDRFLGILFEQDDRAEIWDQTKWVKSNPGLGTVKKVEYLRAQVLKAKNDPAYMPTLLVKDFNIAANSATSFFTREECVCVPSKMDLGEFRYGILGIDAADSIDLNAATLLTMKPGDDHLYRHSMYWLPAVTLEQKGNSERERDVAPYRQWVASGWMRTCPGNKCDKMIFVDFISELAEKGIYIKAVGYDPWHMDDNTLRYMRMAVGENNVIPVRQGAQSLSQPLKQIKADMRDGVIITDGNPCDVFCNANVSVKEDTNGNLTVVKKTSNARVDGFISMLNAYKVLMDRRDEFLAAINI